MSRKKKTASIERKFHIYYEADDCERIELTKDEFIKKDFVLMAHILLDMHKVYDELYDGYEIKKNTDRRSEEQKE